MRHESVFNINGLSVELCVFDKLEMQEQNKTKKLEIKQSRNTRICTGGGELSLSTPFSSSESRQLKTFSLQSLEILVAGDSIIR